FRKKDLTEFGTYKGKNNYTFINDVAMWIDLLSKGDGVYIAEPLSYFRQHKGQNQKNPLYYYDNITNWLNLIHDTKNDGFLQDTRDYKSALSNYLLMSRGVLDYYNEINQLHVLKNNDIAKYIAAATEEYINSPSIYCCSLCNKEFHKFIAWDDIYDSNVYQAEMYNKYTAICPFCEASDRERIYRLYMEKVSDLLSSERVAMLHIAPERNLGRWLRSCKNIDYVGGDLYPQEDWMKQIDITEIAYPESSFDVVLCSHVLEHVPDDQKAMKELYRVMKVGGWGILQVPIIMNIDHTYEDPTITSPEDRYIHFGQEDHVRVYSKGDYIARLEGAGFEVEIFNYMDTFGKEEAQRYGTSPTDNIYIVKKK
ncbi:class I SAM-dependent methyltransferase, partial [Cohnella sp.]|uniref:class I SAM-dependent methyltransferase n=1 Tax=Cohnella sp. TaxID=1883426 RepID=UPI003703AC35